MTPRNAGRDAWVGSRTLDECPVERVDRQTLSDERFRARDQGLRLKGATTSPRSMTRRFLGQLVVERNQGPAGIPVSAARAPVVRELSETMHPRADEDIGGGMGGTHTRVVGGRLDGRGVRAGARISGHVSRRRFLPAWPRSFPRTGVVDAPPNDEAELPVLSASDRAVFVRAREPPWSATPPQTEIV